MITFNERLDEISERLVMQDNMGTQDPIFVVERKVFDYGYDEYYAEGYSWFGYDIADPARHSELDRIYDNDENDPLLYGWKKVYYKIRWEFVTACLTEQGCRDFLKANGHNIDYETRIYAYSGHHNQEWIILRGAFSAGVQVKD